MLKEYGGRVRQPTLLTPDPFLGVNGERLSDAPRAEHALHS